MSNNNNTLFKTFTHFFFSKFHCLPTITFSQPPPPPIINDAVIEHQDHKFPSPLLIKNFNSLYDNNNINSDTISTSADNLFSSSDSDTESVPDFTSAFASHRFFFSSPGSSNSIFDPPENPSPPPPESEMITGGVAVHTDSPDPYADFRESMQEMIESRQIKDVITDWEFLHELLLCYLTLNPKHTHKFIVGAFADVIVSLLSPPGDVTCRKLVTAKRES